MDTPADFMASRTAQLVLDALAALDLLERRNPYQSGQLRLTLSRARAGVTAGHVLELELRDAAHTVLLAARRALANQNSAVGAALN